MNAAQPSNPADDQDLAPLEQPYLITTWIPTFVDEKGELWLDRLWHWDISEHLVYIRHLILATPVLPIGEANTPSELVKLEVPPDGGCQGTCRVRAHSCCEC